MCKLLLMLRPFNFWIILFYSPDFSLGLEGNLDHRALKIKLRVEARLN